MSNVLNIVSEETFVEKLDTQNLLLAAIASQSGGIGITSWADVQKIVRMGLASKVFSVGDQLSCQRGETVLLWDVIGIDRDIPTDKTRTHSLTLQLHDCLEGMQFDNTEALYYAEDALPAGTYHFSVVTQPWYAADSGKTFQFTLTQAVPAGAQLVLNATYNAAIAGKSVTVYASTTSQTIVEEATVSEGSGGTSLGTADGSAVNLNHFLRVLRGSNNWKQSAMRQYLNSEADAGNVWSPKTKFDRPPTWASGTAGMLHGMDADFLAAVGEVDKVTALNRITDGGDSETNAERFFLLSAREAYGENESDSAESEAYPYYVTNSDLSTAGNASDTNRMKYKDNVAKYWFLRSPNAASPCNIGVVTLSGHIDSTSVANTACAVPACCIV